MLPRLVTGMIVLVVALGLLSWWLDASAPPAPKNLPSPSSATARAAVPWSALEAPMRARIEKMRRNGSGFPIFDVEAHYDATFFPLKKLEALMDEHEVAVMALSPRWLPRDVEVGGLDGWTALNARLLAEGELGRFLPVTTASMHEYVRQSDAQQLAFVEHLLAIADAERYPLMGEFYFRRYPRNKDFRVAESPNSTHDPATRDFEIPIDGPLGRAIFEAAERRGCVLQIHYEIEDRLMPPLEQMLARYPHARVIWCHAGRVRYADRAGRYGPAYLEELITRFPNLYFSTSETKLGSTYHGADEPYSVLWDPATATLRPAWRELMARHPDRFMAALDIGVDRVDAFDKHARLQQHLLAQLPLQAREQVAWRSAWRLVFGHDY